MPKKLNTENEKRRNDRYKRLFKEAKKGHTFTFKLPKGRGKFTAAQRAAITRAHNNVYTLTGDDGIKRKWNKIQGNENYEIISRKSLTRAQRSRLDTVTTLNRNKRIYVIRKPISTTAKYRVKVDKDGFLRFEPSFTRKVGGKTRRLVKVIVPIDSAAVVQSDGEEIITTIENYEATTGERVFSFSLLYNGWASGSTISYRSGNRINRSGIRRLFVTDYWRQVFDNAEITGLALFIIK